MKLNNLICFSLYRSNSFALIYIYNLQKVKKRMSCKKKNEFEFSYARLTSHETPAVIYRSFLSVVCSGIEVHSTLYHG
jgi:hypothetical protein